MAVAQGMTSEIWPNPEGRPSVFWGITDFLEAIHFDFEVLCNIREAQKKATEKPKSAKEAYQRSLQNYPSEMQDRVTARIKRQRAKAKKREVPESIDE